MCSLLSEISTYESSGYMFGSGGYLHITVHTETLRISATLGSGIATVILLSLNYNHVDNSVHIFVYAGIWS